MNASPPCKRMCRRLAAVVICLFIVSSTFLYSLHGTMVRLASDDFTRHAPLASDDFTRHAPLASDDFTRHAPRV